MAKHKKKGGCGTFLIFILIVGGLFSIFGEKDDKKTSEEIIKEDGTVWADEYTGLDEFEYYVNGNEIHIKKHIGDSQKLNINSNYDGKQIVGFESAPFMGSDAISVIIPEGTKTMDNNVFNSCDIEYLYLPSTLENIEDRFWDYFFDVKELYYGGTQEQWDEICHEFRKNLDVQEIYCNVNIDDLGTDKSKDFPVIMKEPLPSVSEEENKYEEDEIEENSEEEIDDAKKWKKEPANEPEMNKDERLQSDLKSVLPEDIANKAYDILKNQIGFSEMVFYGRISEGNDTYELSADDFEIYLTASDDVYRIFNSNYVFYENGAVQNTLESINQKRITYSEATNYYVIAKEIVESCLKSPGSANFPWQDEVKFQKNGSIVGAQGYVDALNSLGVEVRSQWLVEFEVVDLSNFSYNTVYVQIDGETSGEFINLD